MSGQLASKRELRRRAMVDGLRATIDEQSARIAELESQLALARPAQHFAGAMLESIGSDSTTLNATDVQVCDALGESGLQLKTLRLRDRLTPAGEAALAAWRESQQEANDATT